MAKGQFISFEGGEGAGKSTQAQLLSARLNKVGYRTLLTREPGGSPLAERIREVVLSKNIEDYGPLAETFLFYAARDDHLEKVIRPALEDGVWVICDRFADSSRVYQGAGGGVDMHVLDALDRIIVKDDWPTLTLVLDIPAKVGLSRVDSRYKSAASEGRDRFEAMDLDFHKKLRQGFLTLASENEARCKVIDATQSQGQISSQIWSIVRQQYSDYIVS